MFNRLINAYYRLTDNYTPVVSAIIVVLAFLGGFAIGIGITILIAWIFMLVYNAIASGFGWPTFSIWVWVGIVWVIAYIKKLGKKSDKG